jgi:hypothetical protein
MDVVLAIIANGRQAIVVIYREAGRNKLNSYSLCKFILNPSTSATSNPLQRGSRRWGVFIYGNHAARRHIMVGMFV